MKLPLWKIGGDTAERQALTILFFVLLGSDDRDSRDFARICWYEHLLMQVVKNMWLPLPVTIIGV